MEHTKLPTLYTLAEAQAGYFTTQQALDAGYSRPLVHYHLKSGRFRRVHRGIYRLRDYPASDHEDHVVAWLWSHRAGVLSHETALWIHDLSDALPDCVHLTVPHKGYRRRVNVPQIVYLHYGNIPLSERTWHGAVPVTTPLRTLSDCLADHVPSDLIKQAAQDGLYRGLFTKQDLSTVGWPS